MRRGKQILRVLSVLWVPLVTGAGCGPTQPSDTKILVTASELGPQVESVRLARGTILTGAQVTVNGTTLVEVTPGFYNGVLPSSLAPGDVLRLEIHASSDVVIGMAIVPAAPIMVTPAVGAALHFGTPQAFSWTDDGNPDQFQLRLDFDSSTGSPQTTIVAGTARSGSIDTTPISATATNFAARVLATSVGTFTGPVNGASAMNVRNSSAVATLVITP